MEKKTDKTKDNNLTIAIVAVLIVAILIGICFLVGGKDNKNSKGLTENPDEIISNLESESAAIKEEDMGEFGANINVDQLLELYNKEGEYSLVWVGRPTCTYCQLTTPIIKKIIKDHGIYISYLNIDEFGENDTATFMGLSDEFSEGFGTPMLLLVGEGQIYDMIDGAVDTAHYEEFMKTYHFIKE